MQRLIVIRAALIAAAILCWPAPAESQYQNVRVGDNGEEVSIAINPTNPLNLVAGTNPNLFFYSRDGGASWSQGWLLSPYGVGGDPSVVFDRHGYAYYAHLGAASSPLFPWIVVQKSADYGASWSSGATTGYNPPHAQDGPV